MAAKKKPADAPLTEREWRIYRAGAIEGAEKARAALGEWVLKLKCGGVELAVPAAPSAEHPLGQFTPQLRRKGS